MRRREWLGSLPAWFGAAAAADAAAPAAPPAGPLMVIGGAEDRQGDRLILRRFVALCRGEDPLVAVLPSASAFADRVAARYDALLDGLGVRRRLIVHAGSRDEADAPEVAARLAQADGVFISGGDQRRLAETLGGTALEAALHDAHRRGACVAGTSAGAAVLADRMPWARAVIEGFGLLPQTLIDQHFSQRARLPRLLRALGAHPRYLGIGVDEDTALVLHAGRAEVIGSGAVTLVDARGLGGPIDGLEPDAIALLPGLHIHRLTAEGPVAPAAGALLAGLSG